MQSIILWRYLSHITLEPASQRPWYPYYGDLNDSSQENREKAKAINYST